MQYKSVLGCANILLIIAFIPSIQGILRHYFYATRLFNFALQNSEGLI